MDIETGDVSMNTIKELVSKYTLYEVGSPTFHDDVPGNLSILDLPKCDMGENGVVKCFFDIVMDVAGPIPKGPLKEALLSKAVPTEFPEPYGLRKDPESVKIDIAVVPQNNGLFCVCKIVNMKQKEKVAYAKAMCFGTPYLVDWSGEVRTVKKCVHYIFEHMGGFQCRNHVLRSHEDGKPEKERSVEEWDFGFGFIEENGPRDNTKNRMLRWVTIQTNSVDSPIYKWHPVLVEKSLRNLAADGVLAQVHSHWPLTLYDLDVRFLRALAPLMPSLQEKAIGFHGEPGAGKTPVARTIAMAMSRHWIKKAHKEEEVVPSFRQASEFDFFRGHSGSIFRPDIFDDGTFSEQQFKKIKAFTDVGNIESMSKERWGAAKWVKGQVRIYCVNDFDSNREPKDDLPVVQKREGAHGFVTHGDFMCMLENAWFSREANESNIMAVLKRTHLFVNTKTFLYVRPAGEDQRPVMRIPLNDKTDLLHDQSRTLYDFYRKGGVDMPQDFSQKIAWEEEWMKAAMSGNFRDVPTRMTILNPRPLFGEPVVESLAKQKDAMYSAANVAANLASASSSGTAYGAPATPTRKRTFAALERAKTVIDISDSPVRLVAVKTEPPEERPEKSLEEALENVMDEDEEAADEEAARVMFKDD
eukprot:Skav206848  [mRNA]  locus=scaffold3577:158736:160658:- [translate_table: standard]